jgi:hypothetical protein
MEIQKTLEITPTSKIFATGVHLQAVEVEINGKKQWRWVVVGFEDDTYFDGKIIDVYDYANSFEELFKDTE